MIVYVAEREVAYEGSDFIGCFKTPDGGKQACGRHAAERRYPGTPLEWRPGNVPDSWVATAGYSNYTVYPSELQE